MSAQKNKNFDPDNRERNTSVVQRFITEAPEYGETPESEKAPKYILFNAMEEAVKEEVLATMKRSDSCKCEKCYNDVCAIVLNNMPSQYVTTQKGLLIKKALTILSMETLTKISNEIFSAMEKIKDTPLH